MLIFTIVLAIFLSPSGAQQNTDTQKRDAALIARVQKLPVSQLDSTLPSLDFESWLKSHAGERATLEWEVNDCGEETGSPADRGREIPLCVEADAHMKDGRSITFMIAVEHSKSNADTRPVFFFGQLVAQHETISLRRLSELLPALVRTQPSAIIHR